MAERTRAPKTSRKLVKLDSFWVPQEMIDRLRTTHETMTARIGTRPSRAEVLRTAINLGLDALERKLGR